MRKIYQSILVIVFLFQFGSMIGQLDPNKLNHIPELDGTMMHYLITKGHGAELKVETKGNEGSRFIIQLPI